MSRGETEKTESAENFPIQIFISGAILHNCSHCSQSKIAIFTGFFNVFNISSTFGCESRYLANVEEWGTIFLLKTTNISSENNFPTTTAHKTDPDKMWKQNQAGHSEARKQGPKLPNKAKPCRKSYFNILGGHK